AAATGDAAAGADAACFEGGTGSGLALGTKSARSVFSRSTTKSLRICSVDSALAAFFFLDAEAGGAGGSVTSGASVRMSSNGASAAGGETCLAVGLAGAAGAGFDGIASSCIGFAGLLGGAGGGGGMTG